MALDMDFGSTFSATKKPAPADPIGYYAANGLMGTNPSRANPYTDPNPRVPNQATGGAIYRGQSSTGGALPLYNTGGGPAGSLPALAGGTVAGTTGTNKGVIGLSAPFTPGKQTIAVPLGSKPWDGTYGAVTDWSRAGTSESTQRNQAEVDAAMANRRQTAHDVGYDNIYTASNADAIRARRAQGASEAQIRAEFGGSPDQVSAVLAPGEQMPAMGRSAGPSPLIANPTAGGGPSVNNPTFYEAPTTSNIANVQNPYTGQMLETMMARINADLTQKYAEAAKRVREQGAGYGTTAGKGGTQLAALADLERQRLGEYGNQGYLKAVDMARLGAGFEMDKAGSLDNYALSRAGQTPGFMRLPGDLMGQGLQNQGQAIANQTNQGTMGATIRTANANADVAAGTVGSRIAAADEAVLGAKLGNVGAGLNNDAARTSNAAADLGLRQARDTYQATIDKVKAGGVLAQAEAENARFLAANPWLLAVLGIAPGAAQALAGYFGRRG